MRLHSSEAEDRQALEAAYDRYGPTAFALARRLCGDTAQAEEAVREAFLSLWRSTCPCRTDVEALEAPLYAIVHRDAVARCRDGRSAADARHTADGPRDDGAAPAPSPVAERRARIVEAVGRLDADHREAVELAYLRGFTYRQIAGALGVPEGTAKRHLGDGLAELRALLEDTGGRPASRTIVLDSSPADDSLWRLWSADAQ